MTNILGPFKFTLIHITSEDFLRNVLTFLLELSKWELFVHYIDITYCMCMYIYRLQILNLLVAWPRLNSCLVVRYNSKKKKKWKLRQLSNWLDIESHIYCRQKWMRETIARFQLKICSCFCINGDKVLKSMHSSFVENNLELIFL